MLFDSAEWEDAQKVHPHDEEECKTNRMSLCVLEASKEMSETEKSELLKAAPLLSQLTSSAVQRLGTHLRECVFSDGTVVVSDGEDECALWFVRQGTVRIHDGHDREEPLLSSNVKGTEPARLFFF